mgnify:CR=1 FL=1
MAAEEFAELSSTDKVRSKGLDQFYTNVDVSLSCIDSLGAQFKWDTWDLVIEPSAGNGSFSTQIPTDVVALDISPGHDSITKQDFFEYSPDDQTKNILVVGNPPFGKSCSLAIKFFNHAAEWANVIAFIIPRTFRRTSVQNKLNLNFHVVSDVDIQTKPCAFNPPMSVKCCFQIWERKPDARLPVLLPTTHDDWEFLKFGPIDANNQPTPPDGADFAIRAYGGKCGEIVTENLDTLRPKSWHWIKTTIVEKTQLINKFKKLDYSICLNTARQNSIGKADLISLYSQLE